MARLVAALALWCGGRRGIPYIKWEMNGPGWDFGRLMVKIYNYPYYYRLIKPGEIRDKKEKKYGWHANDRSKAELLTNYDRALAHGGYVNPSEWGLREMLMYVFYDNGSIGPAALIEESPSARKTHGDVVIADALTIDDRDVPRGPKPEMHNAPARSPAARYKLAMARHKAKKKKKKDWKVPFNFRG